MRKISVNQLRKDLDKYLSFAKKEDILIVQNSKPIAKLVSASSNALENFFKFEGIFENSKTSFEESRIERMLK